MLLALDKYSDLMQVFWQICEEDIPFFAKVGLPHFDTILKVWWGESLVRFIVSDSDHVVDADIWCDGNLAGEIEMHWHQNEFIQRHQIVGFDQWNV